MVARENLHITLHFLGNEPDERISDIVEALREGTGKPAPFTVHFKGCGYFPSARRPRVLWVGVREPSGRLNALYEALGNALTRRQFAVENRRYRPHVTVGYVQKRVSRRDVDELTRATDRFRSVSFGEEELTQVVLFNSTTTPKGSKYARVAGMELEP